MCGLVGLVDPGTTPETKDRLIRSMADRIVHRGPDGDGYHVDGPVALGHRRLSIIDLAGGDQPIFDDSGDIAIVFNGEIYNFKELQQDLRDLGYQLRTRSDTEVIVYLYKHYGRDCLEHLNGMFAFAIWDRRSGEVFIARDRLGEKPLYYRHKGNVLVFASELKCLAEHPAVDQRLSVEALDAYLTYGYIPEPLCILEGVRKLPAGCSMTFRDGELAIERYWDVAIDPNPKPRTLDDVDAEFEELLRTSIRMRLRSDVPVGSFLSGGIDSSLIVAYAAELAETKLSTYSIGFPEQDFSELKYARMVAERYGTDHHEVVIDKIEPNLFPSIVEHFDEPFNDSSAIPTWYVTREAAKHVKVVLSGDAGDELFCGYSRYNYEPLEQQISAIPGRRLPMELASHAMPNWFQGKGRLRRLAVDGAERWQRSVGVFDRFERQALYGSALKSVTSQAPNLFERYFADNGLDEISQRMWADQKTYLPDDILVKVDRNSMWHSLEVRVPLLDHKIVEFANGLPLELKKHNGVQKTPLRRLLEPKVPAEIMNRPKQGFALPIKYWLNDSLAEVAGDLLDSADSRIHSYLERDAVRGLISDHRRGRRDLSKRIWSLLWLEQWARAFKIS